MESNFKKHRSRIISIIIAIALAFTLIPVMGNAVYADDPDTGVTTGDTLPDGQNANGTDTTGNDTGDSANDANPDNTQGDADPDATGGNTPDTPDTNSGANTDTTGTGSDDQNAGNNTTGTVQNNTRGGALRAPATRSTAIDTVTLTVTRPKAGERTTNASSDISVSVNGATMTGAWWHAQKGYSSNEPSTLTFVEGQTYYAVIHLTASDGNTFKLGDNVSSGDIDGCDYNFGGTVNVNGESSNLSSAKMKYSDQSKIVVWISATAAAADNNTHTVSFDMRGHWTPVPDDQVVNDGEKATKPASPSDSDQASDYATTGLRFRMYDEIAPENMTYDTLWDGGFDFNTPITQDTQLHAIYESILELKTYDVTNSWNSYGGAITYSSVYDRTPQTTTGIQTTIIEGTTETLTATPSDNYEFVGWSTSNSEDDIVSTDSTYTFTNEGRKTLYALFKDTTFSFGVARSEGGALKVKVTNAAGDDIYDDDDDVSAGNFTMPKDSTLTLTAVPDDGYRFAGFFKGTWSSTSGFVDDYDANELISDSSPYVTTLPTSDGNDAFYALFEEVVTLTIHPSSREGDDFVDPIVLEVKKGKTLGQVLTDNGWTSTTLPFNADGYRITKYFAHHFISDSLSNCPNVSTYNNKYVGTNLVLNQDTEVYYPLSKRLSAELSIESPLCGKTTAECPPVITLATGSHFTKDSANWCRGATAPSSWTGTFLGGNDYYTYIWCNLDFFYYIEYDTQITVENGECTKIHQINSNDSSFGFIVKTTAEHDWDDPVTVEPSLDDTGAVVNGKTSTKCKNIANCNEEKDVTIIEGVKVSFDSNGGSGDMDSLAKRKDSTYTVPECTFNPPADKQKFKEWKVGDKTYKPGDEITLTEDTEFVAQWRDFELSIHWSSIDGEDVLDPVVIEVEPGTTVKDAIENNGGSYSSYEPFTKDGYRQIIPGLYSKTMSAYSAAGVTSENMYEATNPDDVKNTPINDDMDVYALMFKGLGEAPTATIEQPLCGVEVKDQIINDVPVPTNQPKVTVPDGAKYIVYPGGVDYHADPRWISDDRSTFFYGTFEGGNSYNAVFNLLADFGYYFDENITTVTGAEEITDTVDDTDEWLGVYVKVKALHDMQEHPATAANCAKEGNKEYFECSACGKFFEDAEGTKEITDHDSVIIPIDTDAHDWGEWVVTKEPTETQRGEKTRTCKNDPAHIQKETSVKLNIHWSSVDGTDLSDPLVINVFPGTTVGEAIESIGKDPQEALFTKEGYRDMARRIANPVMQYNDYTEMNKDLVKNDTVIYEDTDVYQAIYIEIDSISLSLEDVKCATTTTTQKDEDMWDYATQTNPPVSSVSSDAYVIDKNIFKVPYSFWVTDKYGLEAFVGTLTGGNTYISEVFLNAKFGYVFAYEPEITVEGGQLDHSDYIVLFYDLFVKIKVEHEPAEPVTENVKEPTCTEDGSHDEVVYCKHCNEEISRETITDKAFGHDWSAWAVSKEPTCTEAGEEMRECKTDASHKETRPIEAIGHDWGEWKETKSATCTANGEEERVCKHDASHKETRETPTDSNVHDWDEGKVTTEPTCTEKGVKTFRCKDNPIHFKTEEIAALGHDWGEWTETKPATCSAKGEEERVCKHDASHKETRETPTDSNVHDWDEGKVTTEPTCTEKGVKTFRCKDNPIHFKTEEIAALGHDWGEWTETKPATCSVNGEEERVCKHDASHKETRQTNVDMNVHDWDEGKVTTEPTCTEKGVKTFTCKDNPIHFKTEEIAALGHDWGEWVVTKEPTETEPGEKTRTCKNDPTHTETEEIPAKGEEPAVKYTITYDLNGGTLDGDAGPITIDYVEGLVITLPSPVREGYTFDYWEGSRYEAGASYTVTEDHTFVAQWKENATPEEPDTPETPESKEEKGTPRKSKTVKQASAKKSAATGDVNGMALWITLISISAATIPAVVLGRRRAYKK